MTRRRLLTVTGVFVVGVVVAAGLAARADHGDVRDDTLDALIAQVAASNDGVDTPAAGPQPTATAGGDDDASPAPTGGPAPGDTNPRGPASGGSSPGSPAPSGTVPSPTAPGDGSVSPPSDPDTEPLDESNVVLLTPFLASVEFGSTVGFLLACNTGLGVVSTVGAEFPGLPELLGPVLGQASTACGEFSAAAQSSLQSLNDGLEALEAANPYSEPFFDALATVFQSLAELKDGFGPLGPTVEALGPIVDYFRADS